MQRSGDAAISLPPFPSQSISAQMMMMVKISLILSLVFCCALPYGASACIFTKCLDIVANGYDTALGAACINYNTDTQQITLNTEAFSSLNITSVSVWYGGHKNSVPSTYGCPNPGRYPYIVDDVNSDTHEYTFDWNKCSGDDCHTSLSISAKYVLTSYEDMRINAWTDGDYPPKCQNTKVALVNIPCDYCVLGPNINVTTCIPIVQDGSPSTVYGEFCLTYNPSTHDLTFEYQLQSPWLLDDIKMWYGSSLSSIPTFWLSGCPVPSSFPTIVRNIGSNSYQKTIVWNDCNSGSKDMRISAMLSIVKGGTTTRRNAWIGGPSLCGWAYSPVPSINIDCYCPWSPSTTTTTTEPPPDPCYNKYNCSTPISNGVIFEDTFDTDLGWTKNPLRSNWERGRTQLSFGCQSGFQDPAFDVYLKQGYILGEGIGTCVFASTSGDIWWIESPEIDCYTASNVEVSYYRQLGSDYMNYTTNYIQAFDGTEWHDVVAPFPTPLDGPIMERWTLKTHDVTQWAAGNAAFRFRFGFEHEDSWPYSGWSIDTFLVTGDHYCCIDQSLLNDGRCDCVACDDESSWDCNSCVGGCPNNACDDPRDCLTSSSASYTTSTTTYDPPSTTSTSTSTMTTTQTTSTSTSTSTFAPV